MGGTVLDCCFKATALIVVGVGVIVPLYETIKDWRKSCKKTEVLRKPSHPAETSKHPGAHNKRALLRLVAK